MVCGPSERVLLLGWFLLEFKVAFAEPPISMSKSKYFNFSNPLFEGINLLFTTWKKFWKKEKLMITQISQKCRTAYLFVIGFIRAEIGWVKCSHRTLGNSSRWSRTWSSSLLSDLSSIWLTSMMHWRCSQFETYKILQSLILFITSNYWKKVSWNW